MGDPKAPALPDNLPPELRKFLSCEATSVTLADGPMAWIDGSPPMSIKPGATPGTATIEVEVMGSTISFPASIKDGALAVDFGWKTSFLPEGTTQWFDDLNAWFKSNGYGWGQPTFGKGTTTLAKVRLTPGTTVAPGLPLTPTTPAQPAKPVVIHVPDRGTQPPPYQKTNVEEPGLPKAEVFAPPANAGGPLEDVGTGAMNPMTGKPFVKGSEAEAVHLQQVAEEKAAAQAAREAEQAEAAKAAKVPSAKPVTKPLVGAGGPGGPKAPSGLGNIAILGIVGVVVAAIAGVVLFGGGAAAPQASGPAASPAANASPVPAASGAASAGGAAACEEAAVIQRLSVTADQLCDYRMTDMRKDRKEYNGQAASIQPDAGDIVSTVAVPVNVGPQLAAAVLAGCDARKQLYCAEVKPSAGPHVLFGIGTVGTVDQQAAAFYEVAVALSGTTPGNGVGSTPWSGPVGDPLAGSTLAYSLRFPSIASAANVAGPFRLGYDKASANPFFLQGSSAAFAVVSGTYAFVFVPVAELNGATTFRQFTFYQEDGNGPSAVDLAPETGQPPVDIQLKEMISLS